MLRNYALFLIVSLMVGCSTAPTSTKFDGRWEFFKMHPFDETPKACLPMEDVKKLRELLIRCEKKE